MRREYQYDLMMVDSNKFDSLNQAISQIFYLTKMLNYYSKFHFIIIFKNNLIKSKAVDVNTGAILDGFVDYHRTICKLDDCPCIQKNMN